MGQILLDQWREILESILRGYIEALNLDVAIAVYLLISQDRNHHMLMHEGWQGDQRFHGPIVHAEMRDEKIWIHYDGTEAGITDELVAAGVPKDLLCWRSSRPMRGNIPDTRSGKLVLTIGVIVPLRQRRLWSCGD